MTYNDIKLAHIAFAAISITFFLVRVWWSFRSNPLLQQRWVKITPHVNDTLLLAAAVYLMIASQQYPVTDNWLTAKVIALLAYIGLGTIAIKRANRIATIAAACCFGYIVLVARTHLVWPFATL